MQGLMQDYPLTLPPVFDRFERLYPDKHVVWSTVSERRRSTVAEWTDRARRIGGVLDLLAVPAEARVGTFAWNTADHLALYWAVPCTGRVLHTLNIRLFPEQLTYIVNHAEDDVVFVDRSLLGAFWQLFGDMSTVRHVVVMDDGAPTELPDDPRVHLLDDLVAEAPPVRFGVAGDENTAASICYTSGTTGNPKGVVYSHRSIYLHSLSALSAAGGIGMAERDRVLPVVPMFHANAWGWGHAPLFAGAELVLPGPQMQPERIAAMLEEERVTMTAGVPTIWTGMLPELDGRDLTALRMVLCGGSAVPRALSEGYRAKIGMPILHAWGMTETSPIGSINASVSAYDGLGEDEAADVRARQGIPPVGVDARIVEPGTLTELPWDDKATGELQVRGPWIAAAYFGVEPSTESFTEDGWLRTGDVGAIDRFGNIRLSDRTKDLVKSGGEWISSVELENHLMSHPAVAEAAVIGVPHPRWQERPLAAVVLKPDATATKEELVSYLEPRVAKWWLPDDVVFIDEVPKTSVGKFSKKDLRARFADHQLPDVTPGR
ncbi:MAG: Long-chain-fatty-acid--CoA ligase [uncultured Corynebacteriales bacterium]|uniref:Long-chain-fatty-acid--CoA ligase n=1 Tax=uncultured Mycobacteriales bacterium TaxID=581187 RepID=A0A6J4K0C3_9ACTN|nr:MAG: Long-chain-fatty-acid--CoA ligase [uncultured Corynebacteriales bacterium]